MINKNRIPMRTKLMISAIAAVILFSCNTQKNTGAKQTADTTHNSQNSLDWAGTYRDTLPCADCEGILTEIILKSDLTYEMGTRYLGKSNEIFRSKGKFAWEKNGNTIVLGDVDPTKESNKYAVGENKLFKLDMDGKKITGELAEKYVLNKQQDVITDRYWKLKELQGKKIEKAEGNSREAFMVLTSAENRIHGNSGCNMFNGGYELTEMNRLKFSKMASTMMACPDMEAERAFLQVLETADNYYLKGDTLILNRARMAPLARFENVFLK
jgi:heat shock protein HslJ